MSLCDVVGRHSEVYYKEIKIVLHRCFFNLARGQETQEKLKDRGQNVKCTVQWQR